MESLSSFPLVSVIVPVYNVEEYLDRCVSSITGQSYPNLEIILVDDGSTDSSGRRCDELASTDSRITVIHSENRGLAGARDLGLTHMHGEWIVFVDSDDFIGPNHILNLLSTAIGSNSPIALTGYTRISAADLNDEVEPVSPSQYKKIDAEEAIYIAASYSQSLFSASAWGTLYHSSLAPLLDYPLGKYFEDHFVTYYVFFETQYVIYEDANDYYYTDDRQDSIMHKCDERTIDILEGDKKLLEFSQAHGLKKVEAEITHLYYGQMIGTYARALANNQDVLAENVYSLIKAERDSALVSPYAATSTKIAMLLSMLPRPLFDFILRNQETS